MNIQNTRRAALAMTLTELLTVIAIIMILASLTLPALSRSKVSAQVQRARLELDALVGGIMEYESVYGRYPISQEAAGAALALHEDITFGGVIEGTGIWIAGPSTYLTNNGEVTAVLLDLECYGDGAPTINQGHVLNPRRNQFINAASRGGTNALTGVGVDGIYRDPWGSPYVVTVDLNRDGHARDFFYRRASVSARPDGASGGLNGLIQTTDADRQTIYEAPSPVIAWSAGPDRHLSTYVKANAGVNRDNVLSWTK